MKSGGRGSGKKNANFPGKFLKNFDFFRQFLEKISIFPGKFPKNFDFSGNFTKISNLQAKIDHLQLLLGKLFYFSSSHYFRTYFLYMIRYNNISRSVHDLHDPSCDPPTTPQPKIWGVATPNPRIYAPGLHINLRSLCAPCSVSFFLDYKSALIRQFCLLCIAYSLRSILMSSGNLFYLTSPLIRESILFDIILDSILFDVIRESIVFDVIRESILFYVTRESILGLSGVEGRITQITLLFCCVVLLYCIVFLIVSRCVFSFMSFQSLRVVLFVWLSVCRRRLFLVSACVYPSISSLTVLNTKPAMT